MAIATQKKVLNCNDDNTSAQVQKKTAKVHHIQYASVVKSTKPASLIFSLALSYVFAVSLTLHYQTAPKCHKNSNYQTADILLW